MARTVSTQPGPAGGTASVPREPPPGLLHSKREFPKLPRWMIDRMIETEGRTEDGALMDVAQLRALRLSYLEKWRAYVVSADPDYANQVATYMAMKFERVNELLYKLDTPRGRVVKEFDDIAHGSDADPLAKYKDLVKANEKYATQLHNDAASGDGTTEGTDDEEATIVAEARGELLRLKNMLTQAEIARMRGRYDALAQQAPAANLEARKEQRRRLREILYGPVPNDPKATRYTDDDLPHWFSAVVAEPLAYERQKQLMGGAATVPEKDEDKLVGEMERNATVAITQIKKGLVTEAKQGIADAKQRLASLASIADAEQRKKEEALALEQLQDVTATVLAGERQRQLMGVDDSEPAAGGGGPFFARALMRTNEDAQLDQLSQEAQRMYREYAVGKPSLQAGIDRQDQLTGNDGTQ
jgi:hypothetical protein